MSSDSPTAVPLHLLVGALIDSDSLARSLSEVLDSKRFTFRWFSTRGDFIDYVKQHDREIDCLLLQKTAAIEAVTADLRADSLLLPAAILTDSRPRAEGDRAPLRAVETDEENRWIYHAAEVELATETLSDCSSAIDNAIAQFLKLHPKTRPFTGVPADASTAETSSARTFMAQQHRLAEKLRARLGYLGVYYKRDPKHFFRHLPKSQQHAFLDELKEEYREIVLIYFTQDDTLNQRIDKFVSTAFFADISVAQIVELHMELMEEFSKQLKLEGRNEEILLDYRLTLIDTIAHLCEMYRRSIPREA